VLAAALLRLRGFSCWIAATDYMACCSSFTERHIAPGIFFVSSSPIGPVAQWLLAVNRTAKGDAQLNSELERDFRNHQQMLLGLLQERKDAVDGSKKALELDRLIGKVESVLRSYQNVKWYEQEVREKHRMQTRDPGACNRLHRF
jgi:hypothetical protein